MGETDPHKHTRIKRFIKRHNNKVILQILLLPIFPLLLILIQAIIFPGLVQCDSIPCSKSYKPTIPDVAMLVIGGIIYAYCTVLSFIILSSPGAWMERAVRNKLICLIMLFLMGCSCFQLIPAVVYRNHVIPFQIIQNYNVQITRAANNAAFVNLSNIWTEEIDNRNFMFRVLQVSEKTKDIQDVSPLSKLIYEDEKFEDTTIIKPSVSLIRELDGLEDGKWYIWIAQPSRKGTRGKAYPARYVHFVQGVTISSENFEEIGVDLRAYYVCQWIQETGCIHE